MPIPVVEIFESGNGQKSVLFYCPACKFSHSAAIARPPGKAGPLWTFNDDTEKPTLSPSFKVTMEYGQPGKAKLVCHSWMTNGEIRFLADSTHELSGKTVPLEPTTI